MALLDRLRPQPGWKHPDPSTRVSAVESLPATEQSLFATLARDDESPRVRRAAVARLEDVEVLAGVAARDADGQTRHDASARLLSLALEHAAPERRQAAAAAIADERQLVQLARSASDAAIARQALDRVKEGRGLGSIARHAQHEDVRLRAVQRVEDAGELEAIAVNTEHKDAGLAALERLTDMGPIAGIAERARNKAVVKRARTLVREHEMQEADRRAAVEASARRHNQILEAVTLLMRSRDVARGRGELARLGQDWEAAGEAGAEAAGRYAELQARAAAHFDGLEAEARAAEAARAAHERAVAERQALIARALGLEGDDLDASIEALTAQWTALEPFEEAAHAALAREFEAACARARDRVAARARAEALRGDIEAVAAEAPLVVEEADLAVARARWADVSRRWRELTEGLAVDRPTYERYHEAESRFRAREEAVRAQTAREGSENLARLRSLCDRATALTGMPEASLKDLDHAVRDLRAASDHLGPLPTLELQEDLSARVKSLLAALQPRLRELRETDDWRRWANAGIQDELCKRVEALRQVNDTAEAARQLRDLRRQWKAVSAGPRDEGGATWERFKTAADEVQARCDAHFAKVAEQQAAHLAAKQAIVDQAESLAGSTDWIATAELLKKLQHDWNGIGAPPKEQAAELARRFRTACDTFFTRRKTDLSERKQVWAVNAEKKEALCARAEALAVSADWSAALNEIKQLQAEWKSVGPVRKNRSEALWKRFRGACDQFFDRYGRRHELEHAQRLQQREEICQALEALAQPPAASAATTPAASDAPSEAPAAAEPIVEQAVADTAVADTGVAGTAAGDTAAGDTAAGDTAAGDTAARDTAAAETPGLGEPVAEAITPAAPPAAAAAPTPQQVVATLESLWARWHSAPGLAPEQMQPLRARFDAALSAVLSQHEHVLRGTTFDVPAAVGRRKALVEEVEELVQGNAAPAQLAGSSAASLAAMLKESLAANTIGGRVNDQSKVRAAADKVRRAQQQWRDLGPVPGDEARSLEGRFHRAVRRFFELHPDLRPQPQASHQGGRRDRPHGPRPQGRR